MLISQTAKALGLDISNYYDGEMYPGVCKEARPLLEEAESFRDLTIIASQVTYTAIAHSKVAPVVTCFTEHEFMR